MSRRHLVLNSFRSFPFGGGEEDLYDRARYALADGWEVTWLCHSDGQADAYTTDKADTALSLGPAPASVVRVLHRVYKTPEALHVLLASLQPTVVYAIGRQVHALAGFSAAPWVASFHFWTHFVAVPSNVRILSRRPPPALSPEFPAIAASAARVVVVSPFMQRVGLAAGACVPTCLPSIPTSRSVSTKPYDAADPSRTWVTVFNGHFLKGGCLLPTLIATQPNVPVRVFFTEHDAEHGAALMHELVDAMNARRRRDCAAAAPIEFRSRVDSVIESLDTSRVVLCASVVDETFGRVAAEAMASGVPVVLSRRGNLEDLGGPDAAYVDPGPGPAAYSESAAAIAELYSNPARLAALSALYLSRAAAVLNPSAAHATFAALLNDVAITGQPPKNPTVLLVAPWHDQGLGTQARTYVRALQCCQVRTAVCSFAPYAGAEAGIGKPGGAPPHQFQAAADEWAHVRVYHSPHFRDQLTGKELAACVRDFAADVVLVLEPGGAHFFDALCELKAAAPRVRVVGVPNIELVRSDEVARHAVFDLLLGNNEHCMRHLTLAGVADVTKLAYLGFAAPRDDSDAADTATPVALSDDDSSVVITLIGGVALDTRKQGPKVVRAFVAAALAAALNDRQRVRRHGYAVTLCITAQTAASCTATAEEVRHAVASLAAVQSPHRIEMHTGNMPHAAVMGLLRRSHVAVVVSAYEGLGMGLFEALAARCAVLTIAGAPHNEVVREEVNGWLLPAHSVPLPGAVNPAALVTANEVDDAALAAWFTRALRPSFASDVAALRVKLDADWQDRFEFLSFAARLSQTLFPGRTARPCALPPLDVSGKRAHVGVGDGCGTWQEAPTAAKPSLCAWTARANAFTRGRARMQAGVGGAKQRLTGVSGHSSKHPL